MATHLAAINAVVDLGEDIVAGFDLSEQVELFRAQSYAFRRFPRTAEAVTLNEHIGEHIETLDVRLEPAGRIFDRRALIDLERPVGGLGKEQLAGHLRKKSGDNRRESGVRRNALSSLVSRLSSAYLFAYSVIRRSASCWYGYIHEFPSLIHTL